VLWMIVVPVLSVAVGLAVAVLADRLSRRGESFTKSLIFLPMAISFVGASTIWGFIYAWRPEGRPQIGLLNEVVVAFGGSPVPWLQTAGINNFALMIIMVWLQAGFAMVLLSAAIKNVPEDTIEAARIDGASEVQVFSRVVVPQIRSTMVVVATTILILVLKIFDIVRVLTNGRDGTDVVANRFINEFFTFREFGRASVLVVALIIATIPFMILNVRRFREQEAMR
jgi:alpha-glucoside transport system permease protein